MFHFVAPAQTQLRAARLSAAGPIGEFRVAGHVLGHHWHAMIPVIGHDLEGRPGSRDQFDRGAASILDDHPAICKLRIEACLRPSGRILIFQSYEQFRGCLHEYPYAGAAGGGVNYPREVTVSAAGTQCLPEAVQIDLSVP